MTEKYYGLFDCKLTFSTYREFREKKKIIYDSYRLMNTQGKVIYRMYVYSRPLLTEKQKDYLWEEMNGYITLGGDLDGDN